MQVGKRGRQKERERLARAEMEAVRDDASDWFASKGAHGSGRDHRDRPRERERDRDRRGGHAPSSKSSGGGGAAKVKFDFSNGSSFGGGGSAKRQRSDDLPAPSRETDSIQIRGAAQRERYSSRDHNRYDDRSNRARDRGRERDQPQGPRYRGGYSR